MMLLYEIGNHSRRYHVVAPSVAEAIEIALYAFKLKSNSKHFYADPIYTLYLTDGRSVPVWDILDAIDASSGYIDGSGTALQTYTNGFEWYPFTPFNVRQHFVDIALAAL